MPLTPQTQAVLEARKAAGMGDLATMGPVAAREQMQRMREALNASPEPIAHVEDRTIPGPAGQIPIRIYRSSTGNTLPVMVFFHGGGWVIGDLDSHDGTCRSIANRSGVCVVAVDYRLAPESRYPAAAEDSYAATQWVSEHAAELNVDASRLAVGGDSAGGNLAAVVALMARDRGGPAIASQILAYPVTSLDYTTASYRENGNGDYGLSEASMRWFWDAYLERPEQGSEPYASPLRAGNLSGLPRALVITAEYDPLRDEGEEYGRRLDAAGVATTIRRYDGVVHGFVGQAAAVPEGGQAIDQIAQELKALSPVAAR